MYRVMFIGLKRHCSMSSSTRPAGKGQRRRSLTCLCTVMMALSLSAFLVPSHGRRLAEAAADSEAYTCVVSGVPQHPCIVNPAYAFAVGFKTNKTHLPDRLYQGITSQYVVCQQYATQAECQATPPSAQLHCSWDNLNSRCMADPYASLLMPLSCAGSKARSFMTCGRKGHINACRTDTECVLGKQARCFPAWLVSEARAKNTTEQEVAEATALAILKGDEAVVGSCPEARLLQAAMQACPYSAGWDTCDTSLCEFSTPSFIPSRVQPIGLGNATATVPTINEAAMQPNSSSELPFYDTYPGPICFPDVGRIPMVLHNLLGVSDGLAAELDRLQARCAETEDVVYDVARGVAACGLDRFKYESVTVYKAVGMQKPAAPAAPAAPAQKPAAAPASAAGALPTQQSTASSSSSTGSIVASAAGKSSSGNQPQQPRVATEIGSRSRIGQ